MYGENTKYHSNPYIQGTTVPCDRPIDMYTVHVYRKTQWSNLVYISISPLCSASLTTPCAPDPIDLTQEDNALQKALALSLQDMQHNTSGAQISLEDQELSR